jgi:hypothetical protein
MGYNTYYELTIDYSKGQAERKKAKEAEIQEIKDSNLSETTKNRLISDINKEYQNHYVTESDVLDIIGFNPFGDKCKWYDHETNMISVSEKFNGVLFILYGDGDDSEDIWKKYFYNGQMQVANAKITFDECTLV